jgi:hypothetical protein
MRRTSTNLSQMALIGFEAGNFLLFACASDFHVLRTFSVRIVIAVGEEGKGRIGSHVPTSWIRDEEGVVSVEWRAPTLRLCSVSRHVHCRLEWSLCARPLPRVVEGRMKGPRDGVSFFSIVTFSCSFFVSWLSYRVHLLLRAGIVVVECPLHCVDASCHIVAFVEI